MIHRIDAQLREEARRFRLVFSCDRCAQFDPEGELCSLGYPNQVHRDPDLESRDEVTFCKAFEIL
jgi:hypothetical protein